MLGDGDACVVKLVEDVSYLMICISKKDKSFVYGVL